MMGYALLADILFIGLGMFSPEVPQMVEAAGRMRGADTVVDTRGAPEGPLAYHWINAAAGPGVDPRAALATGKNHQVVMTETLPLTDSLARHRSVEYAAQFRNLALRGNPETETYLYEGWPALTVLDHEAWRRRVAADGLVWQAFVDAVNDQARGAPDAPPMQLIPLAQGLLALDRAIEAGEVPGLDDLDQLFSDDRRLNSRGNYFAAMLLHAALSGSDPSGLPVWLGRNRPATLDEAVTEPMAQAMQRVALKVVVSASGGISGDRETLRRARMLVQNSISDDGGWSGWQDPNESYLTGIEQRGIGFNLSGVSDWSGSQPFLDLFKTARPWLGHLPGQWGGFEEAAMREGGYLDEYGWPLRMPPEVTHLSTVILSGMDARAISSAGRYVLRYRGKGRIELGGDLARNVTYEDGRIGFDFTPGEGSVSITLRIIDPGDPIREISVVRQDRLALADSGQIFEPDFLARLRGAEILRFMDWGRTNNSNLVTAGDLPSVGDYVWSTDRGVPPEVMVALANELDLDPWFTIPHLADDDLVREYARRVRDNLEPGRRAWVEFSNEIWNGSFAQNRWAEEMAQAAWGVSGAARQYGAWRAAQVADIWAEEFAPSAVGRLVRVVATFTGWPGSEEDMLNAPAWKAADPDGWNPLAKHFDAYAVTGYFYANLEDPDRLSLLREVLAESRADAERRAAASGLTGAAGEAFVRQHRFDQALDSWVAELRNGALSGKAEGSVDWVVRDLFRKHRRAAARYDLELVMYEGGSHVLTPDTERDDQELNDFISVLDYSSGMGNLYRRLIAGWREVSDHPFNFYTAIDRPSGFGSWGVLRYLDDRNPRWDAVSEPDE
ncbi:hypothetical protein [Paracoccus marinaquae]|uniref:Uncharacterized protein n=1 Tax=Paracoccus marinaquae TaxID=2841926 RepID=A0ABS6AHA5_9RHOB|nr:hypothetical protein [Paracoccus marinaquae]MBU3029970.1 hypothetical protein [Paracoccus marinaquae]